jgi:mitofilin
LNEVPKISTPKKTSHGFRNFVLTTVVLTSGLYGAGVWYALKDDDFQDFFTEYIPMAEKIIDIFEDREFRRRFRDVDISRSQTMAAEKPKVTLDESKVTVKPGSAAEPKDISQPPEPVKKTVAPKREDTAPKTKVSAAPERKVTPVSTGVSSHLPLIQAPADIHPLVEDSVATLNQFIQSINTSTFGEDSVSKISDELSRLSHSINALKQKHQDQLIQSLESQAAKFASLGEARASEVKDAISGAQQQLQAQFHEDQSRLVKLYNERLLTEIEATKNVVIAHANNRLLAIHAEREKQFAKEIAERVEREREGRLAKIQELADKVDHLIDLTAKSGLVISEADKISNYHIAVGRLSSVLNSSSEAVALGPYLEDIKRALPDDPVVETVLSNIPQDVYEEGVLTKAQLAARFRLMVPELRKASLLPPNAGVAGHIGSMLFSQLLVEKSGSPVGDDVESIFARAETALAEGRIVDAVAEVNALKGWPKKLAGDWLAEGRKRSEIEFLTKALAEEGKLWSAASTKVEQAPMSEG